MKLIKNLLWLPGVTFMLASNNNIIIIITKFLYWYVGFCDQKLLLLEYSLNWFVLMHYYCFQAFQPSPPPLPPSTASMFNTTEGNSVMSTNEKDVERKDMFNKFSKQTHYQSSQPWQTGSQVPPPFSQYQEKVLSVSFVYFMYTLLCLKL